MLEFFAFHQFLGADVEDKGAIGSAKQAVDFVDTDVAVIIFVKCPTPQDKIMDMLNRVENALGDEWEKQTATEVSDLVYSDEEGNTIIYHVCVTKYYGVDAAKQTSLNTDAISAVISPDTVESFRECNVSNLPAAIYQKTDEHICAGRLCRSLVV